MFIVGPVLVTFLATACHPALGVGVAAAIGLVGACSSPPSAAPSHPSSPAGPAEPRTALPVRMLLAVSWPAWPWAAVFGGMEVVVVAFAKEAGVLPYAGVFLMVLGRSARCWPAWSPATIAWRAGAGPRFRIGAAALAAVVAAAAVRRPAPSWSPCCWSLSGMAIAPTLIASVAVTQASVPPTRLTEALNWTSTGLAAGSPRARPSSGS